MQRWRSLAAIGALLLLGATPAGWASGSPWSQAEIGALHAALDRVLSAPALRGAHVGCLAIDTERGTELYSRNADDEFRPASNFKLLVGSAALRYLGPNFRFATTVTADAPPAGATIAGNLYLRGGGDAHLAASDLQAAGTALARAASTAPLLRIPRTTTRNATPRAGRGMICPTRMPRRSPRSSSKKVSFTS